MIAYKNKKIYNIYENGLCLRVLCSTQAITGTYNNGI